ncbi:MAG: DUF6113 family protein [Candidatus Nanopelagicales bacterium]
MHAVVLVVIGVLLGAVGALLQAVVVQVGGVAVPIGALLVLAALVPVARACAWWADSRWGALLFSVGWLGASLLMATTTPGGDLVLAAGTRQMAYLIGGTIVLAITCTFPLMVREDVGLAAGLQVPDA